MNNVTNSGAIACLSAIISKTVQLTEKSVDHEKGFLSTSVVRNIFAPTDVCSWTT